METIDLIFGGEHEVQVRETAKNLSALGVDRPETLSRLLVTLQVEYPSGSAQKAQAFVSTAIELYKEHGAESLPVLQSFWISKVLDS